MKAALITGITGQDGYWLALELMKRGDHVVGMRRRSSQPLPARVELLQAQGLVVVEGDVTDMGSVARIVSDHEPDEFYHLAAQSHVGHSWKYPLTTAEVTGLGTLHCLEALRETRPGCRFYFAGSSEQFGNTGGALNEQSPMRPESPYAAAKVFGFNTAHVYRRSFGMFVACGLLFNHESQHRGTEFVTRKITAGLGRILAGLQDKVSLGNIQARRDWGHARDYARAMVMMLRHDEPDDFVIATGTSHSVQEFFDAACARAGLDPGECLDIDPTMQRPADVHDLVGDSGKAARVLNWHPRTDFRQLVFEMMDHDTPA